MCRWHSERKTEVTGHQDKRTAGIARLGEAKLKNRLFLVRGMTKTTRKYSVFKRNDTGSPAPPANTPVKIGTLSKVDSGNPNVTVAAWIDWLRVSVIDATGSATSRFLFYVTTSGTFDADEIIACKNGNTASVQEALSIKRYIRTGDEDPTATWGPLTVWLEADANQTFRYVIESKGSNHDLV